MRSFLFAMYGTMFTFAMTMLGAATVFFFRKRISQRVNRICFGFAGGVMSAAAVFSLLLPAVEQVAAAGGSPWLTASLGFLLGGGMMAALDIWIERRQAQADDAVRRRTMLLSAMTLHNMPEGMVIGASYASSTADLLANRGGLTMAIIIGLHNIPEGMAVAVPLISGGMAKWKAVGTTAATGFPTVLGAVIGYTVGAMGPVALALSLSFASGAMLYVVFGELLPESILMWRSKVPAAAAIIGMMTGLLIIYI